MTGTVRLLVRADDAGSSWASNVGCLRACSEGIARSVEVMMPCAWVEHAAQLFNRNPKIDVGVHLTLTSEWDAVKWRPLTYAPSLTEDGSSFRPLLMPRRGDKRPNLLESNWSIDEIAKEFRAQIELGIAMFDNVTHVSAHMVKHFADFDERVGLLVEELCHEFGLMDDPLGHGLQRIKGYAKYPLDARHRISAFIDCLKGLTAGTYIFVDHPAVENAELRDTGHVGYEDVLEDRTGCLQTLISEELRREISALNIELIGYKDL